LIGGSGNDTFQIGGTDIGYDIYNRSEERRVGKESSNRRVSNLQKTRANVISTEKLDFSIYSIQGTSANDTFNISGITYTSSYDWFYLYDGNDSFVGYVGNDSVDGGAGKETPTEGAGTGVQSRGGGNRYLIGGSGNDTFQIGGTDIGYDIYN